jgi:hypothetical protein
MRAPQKESLTTWAADVGRRRSMRVLLSLPILVSGKSINGLDFKEDAKTLIVNAHGALISLSTEIAADQQVTVTNNSTQQSLECRVVYVGTGQAENTQMGIEFLQPSPSFWQIDFPPDDWVVPEN